MRLPGSLRGLEGIERALSRTPLRSLPALSRAALAAAFAASALAGAPAAAASSDLPRVRPAPMRPPESEPRGIAWRREMDAALVEARRSDRPMLIEFWADWCRPCHLLEEKTFSDPRVVEASRRFVAVRVDFDRDPKLALRFNVMALPAVLLADSYGTELARLNGYVGPREFLALMRRVPEDVRPFNRLSERLLGNARDFEALLDMGLTYRRHAFLESSTYFLQEALRAGNRHSPAPPRLEEALFYLGENHLQLREWDAAIAAFDALLARYPSGEHAPVAHLELGKAYFSTGQRERARRHLEPLLTRGDGDPVARQAREILAKM